MVPVIVASRTLAANQGITSALLTIDPGPLIYRSPDNVCLRYEGSMRHLTIGRAHRGKPVILPIVGPDVMIANVKTGVVLAEHAIDPNNSYQPKK